jgi:branched-subunit amino acid transport protein AzlD
LFLASSLALVSVVIFTTFFDAVIYTYTLCFGEKVAATFRLNRRVMCSDMFAAFLSIFLGPLTYLVIDPRYNTAKLENRLSIVSGMSEDIPQGIIAFLVVTIDRKHTSLAMFQLVTSIIGGAVKYVLGIVFEVTREPSMAAQDASAMNDVVLPNEL